MCPSFILSNLSCEFICLVYHGTTKVVSLKYQPDKNQKYRQSSFGFMLRTSDIIFHFVSIEGTLHEVKLTLSMSLPPKNIQLNNL